MFKNKEDISENTLMVLNKATALYEIFKELDIRVNLKANDVSILSDNISKNDKNIPLFTLQGNGYKASGILVSEGFAVLKGSKIAENVRPSLSKSIVNKRQLLFDKGIVENLTFTQDWTFTSPSLAAAIVVGYSINGRSAWKNKKGVSLKEIEAGN